MVLTKITSIKRKTIKSAYSHWKVHLKKSVAPSKVTNEIREKVRVYGS